MQFCACVRVLNLHKEISLLLLLPPLQPLFLAPHSDQAKIAGGNCREEGGDLLAFARSIQDVVLKLCTRLLVAAAQKNSSPWQ